MIHLLPLVKSGEIYKWNVLYSHYVLLIWQGYKKGGAKDAGRVNWFLELWLTSCPAGGHLQLRIWERAGGRAVAAAAPELLRLGGDTRTPGHQALLSSTLLDPPLPGRSHQVPRVDRACKQTLHHQRDRVSDLFWQDCLQIKWLLFKKDQNWFYQ